MSQSSPELPVESRPIPPTKTPASGVPLWLTMLISLLCLGVGLAVSLVTAHKREPPATPFTSVSSTPEVKKPAPTPLELAEQGNPQAVDALEKIAPVDRSIEQSLALSQGHAAEKRLALSHLRSTIAKLGGTPDAESTKRLVQFAKDVEHGTGSHWAYRDVARSLRSGFALRFCERQKDATGISQTF